MRDRPLTELNCRLPILRGCCNCNVSKIQVMLNSVRFLYDEIKKTEYTKGLFDEKLENNIIIFQKNTGLIQNGEVNEETYEKLKDLYLKYYSFSRNFFDEEKSVFLEIGDIGENVILLKERLNFLSVVFGEIKKVAITNVFENETQNNVKNFQKIMNLTSDGSVTSYFWEILTETYFSAKL